MDTSIKNISVFTDGGLKLGMGHVYRTISLANILKNYAKIKFLTTSDDIVINKIKENYFEVYHNDNIVQIEKQLNLDRPEIVIVDKGMVEESFCKEIKKRFNPKIIIFGNISSANRIADVVVNTIIGTDYTNKSYIDNDTGALYLEGPKYLVLRDEFYINRNSYKYRNNLEKILLIFGGSDWANLTPRVLNKLLSMNRGFKIDVVLGPAFRSRVVDKIMKKYENMKNFLIIHRNVNNVSKLMINADLTITSPGGAMFESFYIKCPTIALFQNQYQKDVFKGFPMTYDFDKIEELESFINNFYYDYKNFKSDIERLDVGKGKDDIIRNILRTGDK